MGKKQHLSRLAAPRTWPITRKRGKWIAKPLPGANNLNCSLPIKVVLRDLINVAKSTHDVKKLLHEKKVLVNNKVINEERFAVGLIDVISLPLLKKYYRIVLNAQGKLNIIDIPESEANIFLSKIRNKVQINKSKIQLNLNNGWNVLVDKDNYKTNDVIVFDTKTRKLKEHIPLSTNSIVYFTSGRHVSKVARLLELKETGKLKKQKIAVVEADKTKWESALNNLIIVGKNKPIIKLTNEK